MKHNERGFTLIELVLVITLLGILAIVALPRFITLTTQARQSARDGVVGSVRSGIALWRANSIVTGGPDRYPTDVEFDAGVAATCAAGAPCFEGVLENGVTDGRWIKTVASPATYTYNDGTATTTYTYLLATGSFQ